MIFTPQIGVSASDTLVVMNSPSPGYTSTYICYPNSNAGLDPHLNCAIQQVVSWSTGTTIKWAEGNQEFNKDWSHASDGTYNYIILKS